MQQHDNLSNELKPTNHSEEARKKMEGEDSDLPEQKEEEEEVAGSQTQKTEKPKSVGDDLMRDTGSSQEAEPEPLFPQPNVVEPLLDSRVDGKQREASQVDLLPFETVY